MRRILVSICLCCLSIAPAAARMYQWHNPATGTTQLSGTPPAWYRGMERGPRVFVFENNQLIDDTGIAVSAAQAEALRAEAFGAADSTRAAPAAAPAQPQPSVAPRQPPLPAPTPPSAATAAAAPSADSSTAGKASALKALIDAWDQHQLDQARSLLDMMPSESKSAPRP